MNRIMKSLREDEHIVIYGRRSVLKIVVMLIIYAYGWFILLQEIISDKSKVMIVEYLKSNPSSIPVIFIWLVPFVCLTYFIFDWWASMTLITDQSFIIMKAMTIRSYRLEDIQKISPFPWSIIPKFLIVSTKVGRTVFLFNLSWFSTYEILRYFKTGSKDKSSHFS